MKRIGIPMLGLAIAVGATALSFTRAVAADPLASLGGDKMSVQADKLEVDINAGSAILTGNVALGKGDLKVTCPRVELRFNSTPNITWIKGSGGVTADVRGVHGEAPEVEVDLSRQTLELRGGVRLARGSGWIAAERAVIELGTAKVTLTQVKGSVPVPR
jgi:lipopolysaccharide export system protein LptA